jgi:hypothetical protein
MTRRAKIRPGPRCGGPPECRVKSIDHSPEPGTRRTWGHHDVQCQVPNPVPGPHLDGYPECGLIDLHTGDHDYVRHAAEGFLQPRDVARDEPEPEAEAEAELDLSA